MSYLYIIKLGGSVITAKEKNKFEIQEDSLARIASEIKRAQTEKKFSLIVVHGAGPFGHTNVINFGIDNGVYSEKQKEGLARTIRDCNTLDQAVVKQLNSAGLNAIGLDPNKQVVQENKRVVQFETRTIEHALSNRKIPVLFGQMVPDTKLNASVISGDTIIAFLAQKFFPKKILLGTDVTGVFTADPKTDSQAKLIPVIDQNNFVEVLQKVGESKSQDVTQGMKGKIMKLKETLSGTEAFIFNANETNAVYNALTGKPIKGTKIVL